MSSQTTKRRAVGRGAPGRERVPRAERERQMLDAATEIFAERGYHDASMDEIAAAVGVTKPMLYSYFGSKEGLFAACTRNAAAGLREELRAVVGPDHPPDQLFYAGILAVFEFVERNRQPWLVLHPEGGMAPGSFGAEAARASSEMAGLLEELFRQVGSARGMADELLENSGTMARAMTAATVSVATEWARDPREPKELMALRLMNFAWMGMGDLLAGRLWLPDQLDSA
jgi:AcrR family transcriptional regulator